MFVLSPHYRYPSTIEIGRTPTIGLPVYDFANNTRILGFGNVVLKETNQSFYHNGFDFCFNHSVRVVAPFNAYVDEVKFWFNDKGGEWQTNVRLWINPQWEIEVVFESMATNETYGQLQRNQVLVSVGEYVGANQTIGFLLCHSSGGEGTIHFDITSYGNWICPYDCFTQSAKTTFVDQFNKVGYSYDWRM